MVAVLTEGLWVGVWSWSVVVGRGEGCGGGCTRDRSEHSEARGGWVS